MNSALEPSAQLRLNNTTYTFTGGLWNQTFPDIIIFDTVFVNQNVYSGDFIEHEHKKNLYRVIIGEQGVRLASQIDLLHRQIRDANTEQHGRRDSIEKHLPQGIAFDDYLVWQPINDIDARINRISVDVEGLRLAASRADDIRSKGTLQKFTLPALPSDFVAVLARQLPDIVADSEQKVQRQIAQHRMGKMGESWLSQGMDYLSDNDCPFCGQNVEANDLIAAYASRFNAEYDSLKRDVAQLAQRINGAIGDAILGNTQLILTENALLTQFWKQFISIDIPQVSPFDIQQKYAILRDSCLDLIRLKQNTPIELVAPSEAFINALAAIQNLQALVEPYNEAVDKVNLLIVEQKDTDRTIDSLARLNNELTRTKAIKERFGEETGQCCLDYLAGALAKSGLEGRKETTRQELDSYCHTILVDYEIAINDYLDQFNTGFRVTNSRHLHTGGKPSSQFQLQINGAALELGDARTPAGTPCFKTSLSSGDRNALALAFFLAMLKQDTNLGKKIVVFDDPFTSLDRFRRTCTQQLIQGIASTAKQVVVLSHDPLFLKLLNDECHLVSAELKTLQLNNAGATSILGEWDISTELQSPYLHDYSTLLGFYRRRDGELRAVARTIRPFLESLYRIHYPGHFAPNEWLGDFIGKIRAAGADSGLRHASPELPELEAINGYSKKYHHDQNDLADSEPIDSDELYGYVKRTLKLVGGC